LIAKGAGDMTIAIHFDETLGVTLGVWVGTVTMAEWHAYLRAALEAGEFPVGAHQLADLRRWTGPFDIDPDDLERGIEIMAEAGRAASQLAIVIRDGWEHAETFEHLFTKRAEGGVVVFANLDVACTWLGVSYADAAPALAALAES
jgi:hypothetical protein